MIASSLHKLVEKKTPFQWTSHCQQAFSKLKSQIVSPPILTLPDWSKPFLLGTEASDTGIVAVLSQIHDNMEHVIAYSKTLTKAEHNYCATRKE